ncbi:MAG TPA: sodium:proton antiporter, partial [Steroidobacteraceae bacterium]|nr:sodium:proton antiporter [Steroidobacteraceae bacterium]
VKRLLSSIDFSYVLMQGMLASLLFAGALHVHLDELRAYRWQIGLLAVFGTVLSTGLIGMGVWYLLPLFDVHLPIAYCLAFGALISPTDPIAVMGILKTAGVPAGVETVIAGESLFNDGVGVVLFALAASMLSGDQVPSAAHVTMLFLREAGGGIAFGWVLGYTTIWLMRSIESYQEEVLITLAAVLGGYALADQLHVSGPLCMVVVGLMVGNLGRTSSMMENTRERLYVFWELIDAILNCLLFVLIGFEIIVLPFSEDMLVPALVAIALVLASRWVTIAIPMRVFQKSFGLPPGAWKVLTWGGLRGGISVALALSLPHGQEREVVVTLTYAIVVFSIVVQGLTIGRLVKRTLPCAGPALFG